MASHPQAGQGGGPEQPVGPGAIVPYDPRKALQTQAPQPQTQQPGAQQPPPQPLRHDASQQAIQPYQPMPSGAVAPYFGSQPTGALPQQYQQYQSAQAPGGYPPSAPGHGHYAGPPVPYGQPPQHYPPPTHGAPPLSSMGVTPFNPPPQMGGHNNHVHALMQASALMAPNGFAIPPPQQPGTSQSISSKQSEQANRTFAGGATEQVKRTSTITATTSNFSHTSHGPMPPGMDPFAMMSQWPPQQALQQQGYAQGQYQQPPPPQPPQQYAPYGGVQGPPASGSHSYAPPRSGYLPQQR